MNQNKQHKPGCLANIQCLAIHIEGKCPGPYGVCTCSSIPDNTQRGGNNPFNLSSPTPDGYKVIRMNTNESKEKEKYSNFMGMNKIEVFEIHVNEGEGFPDDPIYREVYYVKSDGTIIGQKTSKPLRKFAGGKL